MDKEEIYQELKRRVIHMIYPPGTLLNELELAKEFNVSRTPIRECLQRLQSDRLVKIIRNKGSVVSPIDIRELKDVMAVKTKLEGYAAELAARNASEEEIRALEELVKEMDSMDEGMEESYLSILDFDHRFHRVIYDACGNMALKEILLHLQNRSARLMSFSDESLQNLPYLKKDYRMILEAIKARDPQRARDTMENHISEYLERIRRVLI